MDNAVLAQQEEISDYFEKFGSSLNNVISTSDNEVGIGETPKETVLTIDKVTLYRYLPISGIEPANKKPLLIAYSLIGSYKMLDLQKDRSVIKNLLLKGIEVYVIDWGHPNKSDKWLSFDDYILSYLADCVDFITAKHSLSSISLLGICEGGVVWISILAPSRIPHKVMTVCVGFLLRYEERTSHLQSRLESA